MSDLTKQRTTVTIDGEVLSAARALRLNVSAISERALAEEVRRTEARRWAEENAEALAERRAWIEERGAPLAGVQVLKLG
ncbi:type II toxin-antitoxin system CcdA family antitoxin [Pseudoroseicyclus sp. CXY001]|uniref:type II toxin-antitoxin system CcdA family antitoxin n=1 Tax=Pseudoroseicyclus sp. CXY001 TaxID=3242492 RepID=UPI003570DA27